MPRVECCALLFDMDGVLIDSTPAVARVWSRWALEHGFDPDEVVKRAHGRPSLTTVREYLPHSDCVQENRRIERSEIEDLEGVVPLPGASQLLSALPRDKWTIVTSATRALAEVRLRAVNFPLPKYFVTACEVKNGKPHPEPYLKAAEVLGCPPQQCLVMEDAPAGIHAGKEAGARVIALRTIEQDTKLCRAGADWVVNTCEDVSAEASEGRLFIEVRDDGS